MKGPQVGRGHGRGLTADLPKLAISPELKRDLYTRADAMGISVAEVVREAIKALIYSEGEQR